MASHPRRRYFHDQGPRRGPGCCDSWARCACRDTRPGAAFVVNGPTTTNAAPERTSRQAHVAQKSQRSQPGAWEAPDDHGSGAGGGCDARPENSSAIFPPLRPSLRGELGKSEALLLPGCQPPPARFTPAVSTKPHKTGDSAGARREKPAHPSGMVAGREDGHAYSPETLPEAVARGGSTAGHRQARAIMPLARWLGSPIFRSAGRQDHRGGGA